MKTYTTAERARTIYQTVYEVFDYTATSEIVTPPGLVKKQVNSLSKIKGKVLIPGAGIGSYIPALLECGIRPSDIYAVELSPVSSRLGGRMFNRFGVNYINSDFLTWDPQMQFDVVIGNPPFQATANNKRKDQASNLWTKFWVKSLELAKDSGTVSLITPTSWLSPSANLRGESKYRGKNRLWDVFDTFTSIAQVTGVGQYFKGVGSSFGIVTVSKSGNEGLSFAEGYSTDLGFLPKGDVEGVTKKLKGESTLGSLFPVNQDCGSGWRVSTPLTRKVNENSVEILRNSEVPVSGSDKVGLYLYTHVSSEEEANKVREVVLNSTDILNTHCRWSGFMNVQIFKMLNLEPTDAV